jgi:hypothetical protein
VRKSSSERTVEPVVHIHAAGPKSPPERLNKPARPEHADLTQTIAEANNARVEIMDKEALDHLARNHG